MEDVYATILGYVICYVCGLVTMFFIYRSGRNSMETNNRLCDAITDNNSTAREGIEKCKDTIDECTTRIDNIINQSEQFQQQSGNIAEIIEAINQSNNIPKTK